MDEPDRSSADRPNGPSVAALPEVVWVRDLPPPPFIDPATQGGSPRFSALSPRVALLIGAAVVIGLLLWMARDNLRPFIVGLLLVYLLDPPVRWLTRRGLRRSLAILLVYVVAITGLVAVPRRDADAADQRDPAVHRRLPSSRPSSSSSSRTCRTLRATSRSPIAIRDWIDALIAEDPSEGGGGGRSSTCASSCRSSPEPGSLIGAIFGYVILPVWVFYLLKDRVALVGAVRPRAAVGLAVRHVGDPADRRADFGQWVRGQLILGFAVGLFTFVGLTVLSHWSIRSSAATRSCCRSSRASSSCVPIIGPIISAIPAVLIAATAGIEPAIAALVLYTLVQQVENNFLVPKIQGDAVELHPAAVIFAIVIGGALAGLLGAILALPITAAGRDVVRYLFRRLSPDAPDALATSIHGLGLERHPGIPGSGGVPVPHQREGTAT